MPRSSAVQIVWIERSSSVPPHIQPPMAQVPRPMRDGTRPVPAIFAYSIISPPVSMLFIALRNRRAVAAREALAAQKASALSRNQDVNGMMADQANSPVPNCWHQCRAMGGRGHIPPTGQETVANWVELLANAC